jgi:type I restriction enzyme, S subunit
MPGYLCPPGYKQTEVGIIPQEWEVKPLREIGNFGKGIGLLKEDIKSAGSTPAIPYTALYTDFSEILNYNHIKWFVDDTTRTYIVNKPCVLIASSSNMTANTGKASALTGTTPVAIGREVIIFRTSSSCSYISYLLSTPLYRRKTLSLARGTTIKHLYPATFLNYKIALPPSFEQRAITGALSDVDELVGALDQLIAKKRDLKHAAMQQLLTGKKRLPGFSGQWEQKPIGEHIDLLTGFPFPSSQYSESGIRLLRGSNVKRGETDWAEDLIQYWPRITPEISKYKLEAGDLVIAMDGSLVGRSYARLRPMDLPAVLLQRVARIRSKTMDIGFLSQFVGSDQFIHYCDSVKTVTAIPHISSADIRKFVIPIPPSIKEQTAIAEVLTAMDAELAALEQRRDKTRDLKQGMMQELLTGKTRLVDSGKLRVESNA